MTNIKIDKFRRFGFTSTAYISGSFDKLAFYDRRLIKDSNFKFKTQSFSLCSFDDMFNGCSNAVFNHTLTISSDITTQTANRMFKDCSSALLPTVSISESNLSSCESMFEGCENAKLGGISFPKNAKNVTKMFKGCKTASFDTIGLLNSNTSDYTEAFYGCSNGAFRRLRMPELASSNEFVFSYMFYGCSKLDSDSMNLDNVSESIRNSDYMFCGAGNSGSETFDNCLLNFGSVMTCTSMFDSSKFSFDNTYLQFYSNGSTVNGMVSSNTVDSLRRLFYGISGVKKRSPVVVMGNISTRRPEDIEEKLDGPIDGNYVTVRNSDGTYSFKSGITDFSEMFAYSSISEVDLRGISNNITLDSVSDKLIRDFTSTCEGCTNLNGIRGYVPSHGKTYKNMFKGCKNLKADMSKMFMRHTSDWITGETKTLKNDATSGDYFDSYGMSSVEGMFSGCDNAYSSSDDFDLVSVPKTVYHVLSDVLEVPTSEHRYSFRDAMPSIRIATKNPILGLEDVDYDIGSISKKYGITRYNSYDDDPYDLGTGSPHPFGVYSNFMKYMFSNGFYRFGGFFKGDSSKFFCVIEHPIYDETDGFVTSFYTQLQNYNSYIIPNSFREKYETDSSQPAWNEYKYTKLYGAKIYSSEDGSFIKNSFVGSYQRIYNERRIVDGAASIVSTTYDMPVTFFDINTHDISVDEL